jgi:hypothetical protein
MECLRVELGNDLRGLDLTIYGAMLVVCIICMPKTIVGMLLHRFGCRTPGRNHPDKSSPDISPNYESKGP